MAAADTKNPKDSVGEIFQLTKAYALQETVTPIKGLGKFIAFGIGAAVLGGIGIVLTLLGVLRLLQTETGVHLGGNLSWIPYLITLVVAGVFILMAVTSISRKKGRQS